MKSKCGKFVRLDKDASEVVDKLVKEIDKLNRILKEQSSTLKLFNTGTFKDIKDIQANALEKAANELFFKISDGYKALMKRAKQLRNNNGN